MRFSFEVCTQTLLLEIYSLTRQHGECTLTATPILCHLCLLKAMAHLNALTTSVVPVLRVGPSSLLCLDFCGHLDHRGGLHLWRVSETESPPHKVSGYWGNKLRSNQLLWELLFKLRIVCCALVFNVRFQFSPLAEWVILGTWWMIQQRSIWYTYMQISLL